MCDGLVNIQGIRLFRKDRGFRGGGVAIYYTDNTHMYISRSEGYLL